MFDPTPEQLAIKRDDRVMVRYVLSGEETTGVVRRPPYYWQIRQKWYIDIRGCVGAVPLEQVRPIDTDVATPATGVASSPGLYTKSQIVSLK